MVYHSVIKVYLLLVVALFIVTVMCMLFLIGIPQKLELVPLLFRLAHGHLICITWPK